MGHGGNRSDGELGEVRGSGGAWGLRNIRGCLEGWGLGGLCGMAGSLGDGVGRKGSISLATFWMRVGMLPSQKSVLLKGCNSKIRPFSFSVIVTVDDPLHH